MKERSTLILTLVVIAALVAAIFAGVRLSHARDDAQATEEDLNHVRIELSEIMNGSGGPAITAGKFDSLEANRRMVQASAVVGLTPKFQGNSPDTLPVRHLGESDYSEQPVILRFNGVTIREVLTFLRTLAVNDPGCRSTGIELSPPDGAASNNNSASGELWTADLTVSYLLYTPKDLKQR